MAWQVSYSGSFQESMKELTVQYNREKWEPQMMEQGGPNKHGQEDGGSIAQERRPGYAGSRVRNFLSNCHSRELNEIPVAPKIRTF